MSINFESEVITCVHCGYTFQFNPSLKPTLNAALCRLIANNGVGQCMKCGESFEVNVDILLHTYAANA